MRLRLFEEFAEILTGVATPGDLRLSLSEIARKMGYDHYALAYDDRPGHTNGRSTLVHDYPDEWAKVYIGFDLCRADPIRRGAEKSFTGFTWQRVGEIIPLTPGDRRMLSVGRDNGIDDGYTVPRHLPGEASGSCSFVVRPGKLLPDHMLDVSELVGALALATTRRIIGIRPISQRPVLTDRQCECVLWSARGKTAEDIGGILGISKETVIQHLKAARERYDVHSRSSLILCALFDGLISFADIFRWWRSK